MRSIGLIGSLAALALSAPLAAQSNKFRTDGPATRAQIPSTIQNQQSRRSDKIPPGQLPPAGMCRIWIDGVPPGQQPAPTDCQTAVANKPANARVLWGSQSAFPGKGKSKAKGRGNGQPGQDGSVLGSGRRHGSDDQGDDNDDDDNGSQSAARGRSWPTTIGGVSSSGVQSQGSLKSRRGKGRGDD